jgi:predicted dehydrogenase
MASHGVELVTSLYGKAQAQSVYAFARTVKHGGTTTLEDDALMVLDFGQERRAIVESSWAQMGGLCDRLEVYGTSGHLIVDLAPRPGMVGYSELGFRYATEKAAGVPGWTPISVDDLTELGYVAQAADIARSLAAGSSPTETGEDGLRVLEVLEAAYKSASTGEVVRLRS